MGWWTQLSEMLRNFALIAGGAIGIYLAWLRVTAANQQAHAQRHQAEVAAKQADLGQRKLISDLFSQAVGQLRDDKLEIRLFALYTLQRLAEDGPDYRHAVIELLTAYLRENPRRWDEGNPPVDVRAIMKFLGNPFDGG